IRGFAINRFTYGIYGDGTFSSPFGGFNVIEGNYIGIDPSGGTAGAGSQSYGIYLTFNCHSNRIGGATAAARNVLSGNRRVGVFLFQCANNTLAGNFIGTDPTDTNALGNGMLPGIENPIGGVYVVGGQGTV